MIIKRHTNNGRLILAVCDSELLGKVFEEGNRILDLSSEFYKGKETPDEEFREYLKKFYILNAVGKKTIGILTESGLVEEKEVMHINGIPYVQVLFEG